MALPKIRDIAWLTRQVATRSAMNSNLWQSAITTPFAIVACLYAPEPLNYMLLALGALPIVTGQSVFVYFARKDPQRLQSEAHIEKMETLPPRIGSRASGETVEIELKPNAPATDNPMLLAGNPDLRPEDIK
jgi:hypothetical protein